MNGNEKITLESFDRKLTRHIDLSEKRSEENAKFMKRVEPIIKAYHNKRIINEFINQSWKTVVGFLTVLAIIGSIVGVAFAIFRGK